VKKLGIIKRTSYSKHRDSHGDF